MTANPLSALSLAEALSALVDLLPPGVELVLRKGAAPVDSAPTEGVEGKRTTGAERSKRWRDRHGASRVTLRNVTEGDAGTAPPRNAESVTRNGSATVCDGLSVTRNVTRDVGGVGGAGLLGLPDGLNLDLKPSKQAQPASPDARETATPRNVTRNASATPATGVTTATPVTEPVTPATLGFHPALLTLGDREGLGVPSANAEAKWRKLANEPNSGVVLSDGKIILLRDIAITALKVEAAKARYSKPRDPWAWVLPGFGEGYARSREAEQLRREAVIAVPIPRHVVQEREAKARWDALTPEQQAAEDASRQADIDRMLKGVRRVPNGN